LIVDLVNRLKPAHTNALVKFQKNKCWCLLILQRQMRMEFKWQSASVL
jgi:hypothetical protein